MYNPQIKKQKPCKNKHNQKREESRICLPAASQNSKLDTKQVISSMEVRGRKRYERRA
jgi:hypothetical protein